MKFALDLINMLAFFTGVLCIAAWYNTLVPIYRRAPAVVTRVPAALGLLAVIACELRDGFAGRALIERFGAFLLVAFAASFALCFAYGWLKRKELEEDAASHRAGRFSPVMVAWSLGLVFLLVMTGVNSALQHVRSPFYIHV